jgi:hypothetical protein
MTQTTIQGEEKPHDRLLKRFSTTIQPIEKGTILWFGMIEGKKSCYYGIEWDDPVRGKHSGMGLFSSRIPNAASFLAEDSKLARFDWGRSFLDALREKYLTKANQDDTIYVGSGRGVVVQTVGWDKMEEKLSKLDSIREVGLSNMGIAHGNQKGEILNTCPAVEDLDLSRNLLADLESVAAICRELPNLKILRLSFNRFTTISSERLDESFKNVIYFQD